MLSVLLYNSVKLMFTILVVVSILTQALTAAFVLAKNPKSLTNILFFYLSAIVAAWALINFLITRDPFSSSQLILYRFMMFTVVAQNIFFFLFANTFPSTNLAIKSKRLKIYLGLSTLTLAVTITPLVFASIRYGAGGGRPVTGPGMILFGVHAAVSVIGGLRSINGRYRKAVGKVKQQIKLIYIASIILWGVVPLTNFGITLVTQTLFFTKISPLYTLTFSSIIAYAIVAQKLFDIRAAVARSVGYLAVIIGITLVYGVGLFGVIDVLFRGANNEILRQVLSVILITPLALQFQRTKQFIDRATNRLFYRDAYDSQEVLDRMGGVVVSKIELYHILRSTRTILSSALKASYVEFILIKNDKIYFEAQESPHMLPERLVLGESIRQQRKDMLIVDEMKKAGYLNQQFIDARVTISLRLKTQDQIVGYILFGDKRSGDIYTVQDRKLLEILAKQLSVSIQNALLFEEIQNFNVTLQAKVNEATRNVRTANEKLKALDESKDDFISMASHQLRTPLTSVKGYLSLVLEGDAGKVTKLQKEMLDQAFTSSQRMVYLIADLLNVSRIKTGKFIIESRPVDLSKLVSEELLQLSSTIKSHELTLEYQPPANFPVLALDETKVRQVVMNFADNAIYYTPPGGKVKIELIDKPSSIEFRVIDNGLGVPKAEQPHLFTKFYRAANARKARPDGTGLGLFMAKKVIVAQGGALIFNSVEGKGSTFGFSFSKADLAKSSVPAIVK